MIHAMLIEDDAQMCEILSTYFENYSILVQSYREPQEALEQLQKNSFDVIILDLNLPQMDGLDVCRIIRDNTDIPIIITSARGSLGDKVLGLEIGADDYLPKPFDPRELVARVKALTRRQQSDPSSRPQTGSFMLNKQSMRIEQNGKKLDLTPAEFEVFSLFLSNPNRMLSRDHIVDNVESMKWESISKSVDVIVGRIRKKIGDNPRNPRHIRAIKGFGYQFIP